MLRRLGYVVLIATFTVVGIAMGAHGSTPVGHSAAATSSAAGSAMPQEHDHAPPVAPHLDTNFSDDEDSTCVDCAGDHAALLMACVFLALIVIVSLVFPLVTLRHGLLAPGVSSVDTTPRGLADPRPPELTELCVIRQ